MRIEHWSEAIDDYDQTAALVCALDLVVSVCTALVHLGGALGRPVWVMAPYSPEWRYGFSGESMVLGLPPCGSSGSPPTASGDPSLPASRASQRRAPASAGAGPAPPPRRR